LPTIRVHSLPIFRVLGSARPVAPRTAAALRRRQIALRAAPPRRMRGRTRPRGLGSRWRLQVVLRRVACALRVARGRWCRAIPERSLDAAQAIVGSRSASGIGRCRWRRREVCAARRRATVDIRPSCFRAFYLTGSWWLARLWTTLPDGCGRVRRNGTDRAEFSQRLEAARLPVDPGRSIWRRPVGAHGNSVKGVSGEQHGGEEHLRSDGPAPSDHVGGGCPDRSPLEPDLWWSRGGIISAGRPEPMGPTVST
jgi:hypothetical protein